MTSLGRPFSRVGFTVYTVGSNQVPSRHDVTSPDRACWEGSDKAVGLGYLFLQTPLNKE